jgi:UDP-N-acetylglucosamine diphosphorylase/glucosamine-1-phosphate N-acetyltransferase
MDSPFENTAVIILAAGLGTRMKSDRAKVLHEIQGRPMIHYVVRTARNIAGGNVVVVVGHQADRVRAALTEEGGLRFALQSPQLGTGHAVSCALPEVPARCEHVVILCGDVPLIQTETLRSLVRDHLKHQRDLTVLVVELSNPTGYGRIITDSDGRVVAIVEESDATVEQKKIRMTNTGIYCVNTRFLREALTRIGNDNAQGEYYLTDMVAVGHRNLKNVGAFLAGSPQEFHGINSREDLQAVATHMREQLPNIS